MEALEQQITSGLGEMRTTMEGEIKALKDEHAGALRQWERRLAQVGAGYGGASAASGVRKPVARVQSRQKYPELVTREPASDDEEVYGATWPLVEEWRRLREGHPSDGRSLSWLVTEERILELELAMLEKHGLTLPPETQPLTGHWRRGQLSWRWTALYDTQTARVKRELLRWVRRIRTLGLWRFYKGHRQAMRKLFERTVRTAVAMELVDLAVQAVDGTKVVANASVDRSYDARG